MVVVVPEFLCARCSVGYKVDQHTLPLTHKPLKCAESAYQVQTGVAKITCMTSNYTAHKKMCLKHNGNATLQVNVASAKSCFLAK